MRNKTTELRQKWNQTNYTELEGKELGHFKILNVYEKTSKIRKRKSWMAKVQCTLCGKKYNRPCNTLGTIAGCVCARRGNKYTTQHYYYLIKSKDKEDCYRINVFDAIMMLEYQDDIRAFAKRGELADVPHQVVMTNYAVMILPHMVIVSRRIAKLLTRDRLYDIQTWLQSYIAQRRGGCYGNVLNEDLLTDELIFRWELKKNKVGKK
jgi:hypothetical protein